MIRLTRKLEFSSAHFYHNPKLSAEENRRIFGKCNNPHGHGHNYVLEVTVGGEPDPETGMILDLNELKEILDREVTARFDHKHLNHDVPELAEKVPTCEEIATALWRILDQSLDQRIGAKSGTGRLDHIRLYESPDLFVDCSRNGR